MSFLVGLRGIFTLIFIILVFLFPAYLIDAIRLQDEEKARDARGKACASFGCAVILLLILFG